MRMWPVKNKYDPQKREEENKKYLRWTPSWVEHLEKEHGEFAEENRKLKGFLSVYIGEDWEDVYNAYLEGRDKPPIIRKPKEESEVVAELKERLERKERENTIIESYRVELCDKLNAVHKDFNCVRFENVRQKEKIERLTLELELYKTFFDKMHIQVVVEERHEKR